MAHDLDILNPGDWLYETKYSCVCVNCHNIYYGPKNSVSCWEHTSETFKEYWVASFQEPINPPLDIPSGQ